MSEPELKNGWTRVTFGDVVQLSGERSNYPEADGFDRYVGLDHIEPGDLKIRRWGSVAEGTTFTNVFRPGQVLFGKRRAYQRKVAVADFTGVCSGDIYVFEPKNSNLLPELLPFICQTDEFFQHAVGTSAGSLSPRTNWESLASYELALPALEEQRQIVKMLGTCFSTTERYVEVIAEARVLRASTLYHFFGGGDLTRHPQPESTSASGLARTWRKVRLAEVSRIVRGSTPRPAQDPRFFGGSHVPWITVGELTKDDSPFLTETATMLTEEGAKRSRLLRESTVVLTNSGFSLGIPKILSISGCANDGIAAFEDLDDGVVPLFLYYRLFGLTKYFRTVVAAGGDQPNLNTSRIGEIEIALPNKRTQEHIATILRSADEAIQSSRRRAKQLRSLADILLNATFDLERVRGGI